MGLDYETILVLLGKLSSGADDIVDQRGQMHGLRIKLKLARLRFLRGRALG